MNAFCEACGSRLTTGARFCEACGQPVASAASDELHTADSPPRLSEQNASSPASTRTTQARTWVGVALMVLSIAALVYFWNASKSPSLPPALQTATMTPPIVNVALRPEREIESAATTPISVNELESLKNAVMDINRAQTEAIFANSPDISRLSDELIQSITVLGHGMHRYYVDAGRGDISKARAEMEAFLRQVEWNGLGLSDDTIQLGIDGVSP